jgi:phosphoribosylaminoimidazolecarboxamide formyltransferase / IMP cyclohydrolase
MDDFMLNFSLVSLRLMKLKYGCNPHQTEASYDYLSEENKPFEVLNGTPGYINLMDALNAWRLVAEIRQSLNMAAATSFKHVSPAGTAVAVELSDELKRVYGFENEELSPSATAYLRARGADPSSSFGDFIAISDEVDVQTANILSKVVSDGIIAPSYNEEALNILKAKKKGSFIILKSNPNYIEEKIEERQLYGVVLSQSTNTELITEKHIQNIVSGNKVLSEEVKRDLIVGLITLKYTQSNSVGYVLDGQMIGIGAGQQSRVDCTKLAGRKVNNWYLRQHPKVINLEFADGVKRQDKINWSLRYCEGDMTAEEAQMFDKVLKTNAPEFNDMEKKEWLNTLSNVSFVSDAFIPFRDNIDHAVKHGVTTIAHTGGSLRDDLVNDAAAEYGITMVHTGIRLFHH